MPNEELKQTSPRPPGPKRDVFNIGQSVPGMSRVREIIFRGKRRHRLIKAEIVANFMQTTDSRYVNAIITPFFYRLFIVGLFYP
ncbi:MAG: hypothetical protein CSA52_02115, partial [Gammaproteobacteria bacterium]